ARLGDHVSACFELPRQSLDPTLVDEDVRSAGSVGRLLPELVAATDRFRDACRTQIEGRGELGQAACRRPAGAPVMDERPFGSFFPRMVLAFHASAHVADMA